MYHNLYEYFRDVVLHQGSSSPLEGEEMKANPTQKELTDNLKTAWEKLGGTVVSAFLLTTSLFAEVTPNTVWWDVPPTNKVGDVIAAADSSSLTNVVINGNTLPIVNKTASGTIATCGPFPEGWSDNTTTILFCESIVLHMDQTKKSGVMYMGTVNLTDACTESPKRCEIVVTVVADNRTQMSPTDPEDFQNEVILKLETTSTNNRMRHWMTMYEKFGRKKDVYNQYPHGKISYGGTDDPWLGMLFKPIGDQSGAKEKLTDRKYIAASLSDLDLYASKSALSGKTFDFSVQRDFYLAVSNIVTILGGKAINLP